MIENYDSKSKGILKWRWSVSLLLLLVLLSCAYGVEEQNLTELKKQVIDLGKLGSQNPIKQIKLFHKNPHVIASLLVEELKVIKVYNLKARELSAKDSEAMRVIWCLRALRSLTGQKFLSNTEEEKTFPIQKHLGQKKMLPFWAEWMSREMIFVAPEDVQRDVIVQWKKYIESNPRFKVREYSFGTDDDWYF